MTRFALLLPFALAALTGAARADTPYYWKLVSIDGVPFTAEATLAIDGDKAFGQAPCNRWQGTIVKEPFPEWNIRHLLATRKACPDLAAEAQFFDAMQRMTHSGVGIGHLELVDKQGHEMKFVPVNP